MTLPRLGERPPTAGLPPRFADLFPTGRDDRGLELALTRRTGAADTLLLSSGTACLLTIFEHLRATSPRRTVIIPAYTCPLVVLAAVQAGLRVVACDVARSRFDFDLDQLARLIDGDTLCVVPTHYGGWLTDVAAVRALVTARDPTIFVIEDAAQAFGATWNERSVGLAGHAGIFSFAAGKGLTVYEGGAMVAPDAKLMMSLRATARSLVRPRAFSETGMVAMLAGYHLAYNSLGLRLAYGMPTRYRLARGDDIAAAGDHFEGPISVQEVGPWRRSVGVKALSRLQSHLDTSRITFDNLAAALQQLSPRHPQLQIHRPVALAQPSATFVFVTLPPSPDIARNIARLWRSRLGISKLFTRAIGDYPYLAGMLAPAATPNARDLALRTIIVSTAGPLDGHGVETVVQAISECLV